MKLWQFVPKIILLLLLLHAIASPEVVLGQRDTEPPVITHKPVLTSKPLSSIKINADVTDNETINSVTLFYKTGDKATFTPVSMMKHEQTYKAEIPGYHVYDEITYYIEANDGTNSNKTEEYTLKVKLLEVDYTKLPPLLITEIVPNSTNIGNADGYEFVEIYNNSNKAIPFRDYKLHYRYRKNQQTDVMWPTVIENIVIPPRKTLVFWINNHQNSELTVDDFNAHYGTNLKENQDIVRVYSGGMANNSLRGLVIGTNAGREISVAYYKKKPDVDEGIVYRYPTNKSAISKKIGTKDATPGEVERHQVPKQPVQIEEDTVHPKIDDLTKITEINQQDSLELVAQASDDKEVKSVRLFYKNDQQETFSDVILARNYDDSLFHHRVNSTELIGHEYIDYYFEVSDGTNKTKSKPHRVKISNKLDHSRIRLNVKNEDMLRGEKVIKATTSGDSEMKLLIDGKEITDGVYHSLEHTAYFAFEANGLNTYFQNAVTMGKEVLYVMDQDWLTDWKTFTVPIEPERLPVGDNKITIRSGNKASPFELWSRENRDDFHLRNVRLILGDGTVVLPQNYRDPNQVLNLGDKNTHIDFTFPITKKEARSLTYKWKTAEVQDKRHVIAARLGEVEIRSEVHVDNTAPTIKTNLKKKPYKGAFTIDVDVFDKHMAVEKTKVTLDGEGIEVPYETASSKLKPGKHKLIVYAEDLVGNKKKEVFYFKMVNENPKKPTKMSPKSTVDGDPLLQVKVKDPTKDRLNVTFYEAYKYDIKTNVKGFKSKSDFEPPHEMAPEGEGAFTDEDISLVSKADGKYLATDSETQFPYHRFEVTVDTLTESDRVELMWQGNSLEGRKVSMYAWNYNEAKWNLLDYKIAGPKDFKLLSDVEVSDYVRDSKIQVLVQDEIAQTPEEFDYTFVWLSDTQFYSESYPNIFKQQTQWIADMQEKLNIKYVFHTGDLVNQSVKEKQWRNADKYMGILDKHKIPYGVLAGNHDVDQVNNDYSKYTQYFGEERFKNKPYYGGSYLNNRGHYDLISAGGNDFIMVYLGWGVADEGIQWVNDVLAAYPERKAILNFHEYLLATGTRHPMGDRLYQEIVVPNKNVLAVLSGHYHEAQTYVDEIDDDGDGKPDRTVTQMLADYQAGPEGGQGYMRLLHFDQDNNRILVNTYSPYLDDYNFYDQDEYPEKDEFEIKMDLAPMTKRVATDYFSVHVYTNNVIGSDRAKSGKTAEVVWPELRRNRTYSWYTVVEDKYTGRTVSDIWTFFKK